MIRIPEESNLQLDTWQGGMSDLDCVGKREASKETASLIIHDGLTNNISLVNLAM